MQRIFVGDVQGCADELDELVTRARETFGDDFEMWLVGDLVNRGPYNLRVLRRVRELMEAGRARAVLGNHDLSLLRTAAGLRRLELGDSFADVLGDRDADDWIDWLRRLPLAETGRLGAQPFAMVHAGVHPDWDLDEVVRRAARVSERLSGERDEGERWLAADPRGDAARDDLELLTHCRSVNAAGAWRADPPARAGDAWHRRWASRGHGYGVVYGHWSLQGLHLAPWLRGLDTGCVHHGRGRNGALTAWLPDPSAETPFALPDERFWSAPARRAYYLESASRG